MAFWGLHKAEDAFQYAKTERFPSSICSFPLLALNLVIFTALRILKDMSEDNGHPTRDGDQNQRRTNHTVNESQLDDGCDTNSRPQQPLGDVTDPGGEDQDMHPSIHLIPASDRHETQYTPQSTHRGSGSDRDDDQNAYQSTQLISASGRESTAPTPGSSVTQRNTGVTRPPWLSSIWARPRATIAVIIVFYLTGT